MGEGFPFSSSETNFPTNSYITNPQLTFQVLDNAPKMVLASITIIRVGFSGYRIRTTNSNTLHSNPQDLYNLLLHAHPQGLYGQKIYLLRICLSVMLGLCTPLESGRLPPRFPPSTFSGPSGSCLPTRWSTPAGTPTPSPRSSSSRVRQVDPNIRSGTYLPRVVAFYSHLLAQQELPI